MRTRAQSASSAAPAPAPPALPAPATPAISTLLPIAEVSLPVTEVAAPAQHKVLCTAVAQATTGARSLKERLPYKAPTSWLARRPGVPLATALAFLPAAVSARSDQEAHSEGSHVSLVVCLLCVLGTVILASRPWRKCAWRVLSGLAGLVRSRFT